MNVNETEASLNFDKVCRLCLSRKRVLSPIFEEEDPPFELKSRILLYIGIEVSGGDGLPSMICTTCRNHINAWHKFKEQCERCDNLLRHCISRNAPEKSSETIENVIGIEKSDENLIVAKDLDSDTELGKPSVDVDNNDGDYKECENVADSEKESDNKETTYGCSKCGKTFVYTNLFTFHACILNADKRFVCNLCGKDYSTAGAVKTHLHIHKGKHKCPTCNKSFPSKFQVEVHMRIHTGDKPYVCEYCGKRFAYDKGLVLHASVHTGIKPYKCDECDYSTTSRSYIKNHKSVHRTEKPFVCEICGQGYTLLPSLMNHQLNHNEQKTFACETCGKAFNTRRKLVSHKIMHSGIRPHHCDFCGKKFSRKEGLKEHRVVHTGEKKFTCMVCNKQFAWRKILRTHKCTGSVHD
ncbi:hypothetical protein C0J52_22767 [Blattella germanica]|nr:hypothetical protein C0J52_22767 [Blattella germanica]